MGINNIAVSGGQTGDEAKGMVLDTEIEKILKEIARSGKNLTVEVIRYNGANNAGHTLKVKRENCPTAIAEEISLATHLFPSGIVYPKANLNIARGVVIDFEQLKYENLDINHQLGIKVEERLYIDSSAIMCMVYHRVLDFAQNMYDSKRPAFKTGTTGRGVGPAYNSETDRTALHPYLFLGNKERFIEEVKKNLETITKTIAHVYDIDTHSFQERIGQISIKEKRAKEGMIKAGLISEEQLDYSRFIDQEALAKGEVGFNLDKVVNEYWEHGKHYASKLVDMRQRLREQRSRGNVLVFEGANGGNLDKRWGIQRGRGCLTSSHTLMSEIPLSTGIQIEDIGERLLVFKAYSTKVGWHIYKTEIQEGEANVGETDLTEVLKKVEFGATTGRQRMVGWFDLVEGRTYIHLNNPTDFIISKLDMLSGSNTVKVCTHYHDSVTKKDYHELPADPDIIERCKPEFRYFDGWNEDISKCTTYNQLPENAKKLVGFINEEFQKVLPNLKLKYLSVNPNRGLIEMDKDE